MRRLNKCLERKEEYGLTLRESIKEQNKRLQKKILEKYLEKCFKRMYGDVSPVQRNTGYPFIWHN